MQVAQGWGGQAIGLVRIGEAAHGQEAGDHRVEPEGRGQPGGGRLVAREALQR